ncbi:MAG: MFS transporter [Spirochaetota bacterium]
MGNTGKKSVIILAFIAFISLGLPDGLLGVAWPSMRAYFSKPLDSLGVLLVCITAGYIFSSFTSGAVIKFLGVGKLLAASCAATGIALIGYTLAPQWWLIPTLGVLAGLGAGAIDAGLNSYVARHYNERLMQWLHASFGIGITSGPLIMTMGINVFHSWKVGYAIVGSAQVILALCFLATASVWNTTAPKAAEQQEESNPSEEGTAFLETMKNRRSWLSFLLFFIYAGIELTLGHWTYTLLTESRGISSEIAGILTGSFWGMFTVGRILAGLYAHKLRSPVMVNSGIALSALGGLLLWSNAGDWASIGAIILLGFAVAPIFPGLVSSTFHRVGHRHSTNTIGMQIAGAGLGNSLLPALAGILAERLGLETIPVFLLALIATLVLLQITALRIHKKAPAY